MSILETRRPVSFDSVHVMARPATAARIHQATLDLALELGYRRLTMEGIAARAGVGKQTVYRTWASTDAVLFDALLAESKAENGHIDVPDTGDLRADLTALIAGAVAEMTETRREPLLRAVLARVQEDDALAEHLRDRLLQPQLEAVATRLHRDGVEHADTVAEMMLGAVLHRWALRTGPFTDTWIDGLVVQALRLCT